MPPSPERMTARELRARASLASIFALRMLGLFLILPVFVVHARGMPGGSDAALVGLALGMYALTQAVLHLPLGIASDRIGRKPVIVAGLLMFAAGSFYAAGAQTVMDVMFGRALQGSGAISAAVTAAIADQTRDSQRTNAMAMVGGSIGLTFALAMVAAPVLYAHVGLSGIFDLTGVLALAGVLVALFVVPSGPAVGDAAAHARADAPRPRLRDALLEPDLLRLNFGIAALHAVQMATFTVLPGWLVDRAGLPLDDHWKVYLAVLLASFVAMLPAIFWGERRGRMRTVFLGAVGLLLAVALALAASPSGLVPLSLLLLGFFVAFNVLEASLPSLVSRLAPPELKGTALGVYNTTQAIGLFAGGAVGGLLLSRWGGEAVFGASAALLLLWLGIAARHRRWPVPRSAAAGGPAVSVGG